MKNKKIAIGCFLCGKKAELYDCPLLKDDARGQAVVFAEKAYPASNICYFIKVFKGVAVTAGIADEHEQLC